MKSQLLKGYFLITVSGVFTSGTNLSFSEYAVIAAILVDAEDEGGVPIVILSNPVRDTNATGPN